MARFFFSLIMALAVTREVPLTAAMPLQMMGVRRLSRQGTKRLATIWEDVSEWDHVADRKMKLPKPSVPDAWTYGLTDPLDLRECVADAEAVMASLKTGCQNDQRIICAWLGNSWVSLALSECGARIVQTALDVVAGIERTKLAAKFQGNVLALCESPYGHQVLISLIGSVLVTSIPFVAEEISGQAAQVAQSKFGCDVLGSMIMHYPQSHIASIAWEIVPETQALCRHAYGHIVIQRLIEYGCTACQSAVLQLLTHDLRLLAMDRTASRVVEKALECLGSEEQRFIALALLHTCRQASIADVACSRCGSSILGQLADADVCTREFRIHLSRAMSRLEKSKFGRRVIARFVLLA